MGWENFVILYLSFRIKFSTWAWYNFSTGVVDWCDGLAWWIGVMDWCDGLVWWIGVVDWCGGTGISRGHRVHFSLSLLVVQVSLYISWIHSGFRLARHTTHTDVHTSTEFLMKNRKNSGSKRPSIASHVFIKITLHYYEARGTTLSPITCLSCMEYWFFWRGVAAIIGNDLRVL